MNRQSLRLVRAQPRMLRRQRPRRKVLLDLVASSTSLSAIEKHSSRALQSRLLAQLVRTQATAAHFTAFRAELVIAMWLAWDLRDELAALEEQSGLNKLNRDLFAAGSTNNWQPEWTKYRKWRVLGLQTSSIDLQHGTQYMRFPRSV